jgi:hypothetical protein
MKIERVFVDVPELQRLEKNVDDTAAVVQDWKNTIAKIETEFNVANLARDHATKARETHALAAAMQDAHAIAEIKHARSAHATAEATLADLAVALPAAATHLANAEKAAESARHQLAKLHGEKIMRARVVAAARMDAAFAESAAAFEDFSRLGREPQNFPDLNIGVSGNISHWESVTGYRRIAAALPAFFTKLFPSTWSNSDARKPLGQSEADFWQLPPEKHSEKAA